jgi:hypothetical protein
MSFIRMIDEFAVTHNLDRAFMNGLLESWVEDNCQDRYPLFEQFLGNVALALREDVPPVEIPPPAVPETQVDVDRFFHASLTRELEKTCRLVGLKELDGTGKVITTDTAGNKTLTWVMDPAEFAWATQLLEAGQNMPDIKQDGGLCMGWTKLWNNGPHQPFICIFNGERGPWVDAWIRLGGGEFPGQRNPTILPRNGLTEPFAFRMPDGKYYTILIEAGS